MKKPDDEPDIQWQPQYEVDVTAGKLLFNYISCRKHNPCYKSDGFTTEVPYLFNLKEIISMHLCLGLIECALLSFASPRQQKQQNL